MCSFFVVFSIVVLLLTNKRLLTKSTCKHIHTHTHLQHSGSRNKQNNTFYFVTWKLLFSQFITDFDIELFQISYELTSFHCIQQQLYYLSSIHAKLYTNACMFDMFTYISVKFSSFFRLSLLFMYTFTFGHIHPIYNHDKSTFSVTKCVELHYNVYLSSCTIKVLQICIEW